MSLLLYNNLSLMKLADSYSISVKNLERVRNQAWSEYQRPTYISLIAHIYLIDSRVVFFSFFSLFFVVFFFCKIQEFGSTTFVIVYNGALISRLWHLTLAESRSCWPDHRKRKQSQNDMRQAKTQINLHPHSLIKVSAGCSEDIWGSCAPNFSWRTL